MNFRPASRRSLAFLKASAVGFAISVDAASANTIQINQVPIGTSVYTFSVAPDGPDSFGAGSDVRAFYAPNFSAGLVFGGFTDTITISQYNQSMNLLSSFQATNGISFTPSSTALFGCFCEDLVSILANASTIVVTNTLNVSGAMTFQSASLFVGAGTTAVSQTPLPPAWTMMLIGLAGFGWFMYRRRMQPS